MAGEFEACLAESGTVAFRVAFRILRRREDAEDVSQEAVIRAMQRFDTVRDRSRFRAWLVRVAWRLALDRRRSEFRRAGRDTHLVSTGIVEPDAERELIARERAAHIRAIVDQLPERLRDPLVLGNMEGRSLEEVATLLQLPAGTIKSRSFEARQRVKRRLLKAGVVIALGGCTLAVVQQREQQTNEHAWPSIAPVRLSTVASAVQQPIVPVALAPNAATPEPKNPRPIDPRSLVLKVTTVEVPVVTIPLVKIPIAQIPIVEATTTTIPSGLMEKQR